MNLNKGISTPIAILLIVVVSAVVGVLVWQFTKPAEQPTSKQPSDYTTQSACEEGGYHWYKNSCHEEEQPKNISWKEPAERVVNNYGEALKTRKRDKVIPYTTGELEEEVQGWLPVFGTSNPHPDGIKVLSSKKIGDNKFKIKARLFEAYTGEGRIGYSDNTYTVKKVQEKYLIGAEETGEYIDISKKDNTPWKTYTNEEYGFKFKYPENWRGISTSSERMGTNFLFSLTRDRRKPVGDSLQFSLSIYEDKNMAQSEALKKGPIETERKDIASESTEIFTYSGDFQGPHDVTFKMSGQYTWLEKDNLHFLLDGAVAGDMDDWSEKEEVFSKILSTFKFTK